MKIWLQCAFCRFVVMLNMCEGNKAVIDCQCGHEIRFPDDMWFGDKDDWGFAEPGTPMPEGVKSIDLPNI